jgi:oligopeptide/dipeptide ABC transporter ATP-binding protein
MNATEKNHKLLRLDSVYKYFQKARLSPWSRASSTVHAVDGISIGIPPHETLSLVGESGCGKTTTARLILLLEKPTSGHIYFQGRDIHNLRGKELRGYRSKVQAVFQDPWSSLNPRHRCGKIIAEPLVLNLRLQKDRLDERVRTMLSAVGLHTEVINYFPHELSGGMRQRLAVARALGPSPSLIVLDEPVSALDVSIRAQIMNLLKELQERMGIAYLLIAHNLATVRYLSHWVAVMYVGEIVEVGPAENVFSNSLHPYTQSLISAAMPAFDGRGSEGVVLKGDVPSPVNPPPGCRFHPRCLYAFDRCRKETPQLEEMEPDHKVACHLY